jgi:hypothetical protein
LKSIAKIYLSLNRKSSVIAGLFLFHLWTLSACDKSTCYLEGACEAEGVVTTKQAEKDGHTITLSAFNGQDYIAIISTTNLDSTYQDVAIGDTILLRGECWSMNDTQRMTPNYMEVN